MGIDGNREVLLDTPSVKFFKYDRTGNVANVSFEMIGGSGYEIFFDCCDDGCVDAQSGNGYFFCGQTSFL